MNSSWLLSGFKSWPPSRETVARNFTNPGSSVPSCKVKGTSTKPAPGTIFRLRPLSNDSHPNSLHFSKLNVAPDEPSPARFSTRTCKVTSPFGFDTEGLVIAAPSRIARSTPLGLLLIVKLVEATLLSSRDSTSWSPGSMTTSRL